MEYEVTVVLSNEEQYKVYVNAINKKEAARNAVNNVINRDFYSITNICNVDKDIHRANVKVTHTLYKLESAFYEVTIAHI